MTEKVAIEPTSYEVMNLQMRLERQRRALGCTRPSACGVPRALGLSPSVHIRVRVGWGCQSTCSGLLGEDVFGRPVRSNDSIDPGI